MFVSAEVSTLAKAKLKLDKIKHLTPDKIMSKFLKGDLTDPTWVQSKNDALIWLIEKYNLDHNLSIESKDKCHSCNGRGFDILLFKSETVHCKLTVVTSENGKKVYYGCNGGGWKIGECRDCRGTGKIGEIPCPTCLDKKTGISRGTYQYRPTKGYKGKEGFKGIKCLKCGGEGKVKKLIQSETQIEKVDVCKKCGGAGIHTNLHTTIDNLPSAEKLKNFTPVSA